MLLDVSGSMGNRFGSDTRISAVTKAFHDIVQRMLNRSTRDQGVRNRYEMALFTYSTSVKNQFDGIKPLLQVANLGAPKLAPLEATDTALGFQHVERFLAHVLPKYERDKTYSRPAPLVCHITDGEYTGDDPEPVVRRIMQMSVIDGPVLVENIFITDEVLTSPITNLKQWSGITPTTPLKTLYAEKLRSISSPIPLTYRTEMKEFGYHLDPDSVLMFPGHTTDLLRLGFQATIATPRTR